jgi:hypothetical protein
VSSDILLSVNLTIAVALITTASALGAVVITGVITFVTNRMQIKGQQELAKINLRDQHAKDRRQLRREAYVQFLNQVTIASNKLNALSRVNDLPETDLSSEFYSPITDELNSLLTHLNLIRLEGPSHVSTAAEDLFFRIKVEFTSIVTRNLGDLEDDALAALGELSKKAYRNATRQTAKAQHHFIHLAQAALEIADEPVSNDHHAQHPEVDHSAGPQQDQTTTY